MKRGTAKLVDRLVILAATVILAGNTYKVPSAEFWDSITKGRPFLLIAVLSIVGIFGAFTPFEAWRARSLADRNVTTRRAILASFGRMLELSNAVEPPLETGDLALHIWKRKRTIRHPISGVLNRLSTYRMAISPATRQFAPPKGVGVVGLCWEYNKEYKFDGARVADELTSEEKFIAYRDQRGPKEVMNLSWTQFDNVKHRTALFAVPVRDGGGRFVGCVSVDASRGFADLNRRELIEEMSLLSQIIGREDFECT